MNNTSKIFISYKNFIFKSINTIIIILLGFIMQKSIISILGTEYLGINGLFKSIISYLSITELGIGASITFSLYKPLANNDTNGVVDNIYFLKKMYMIIGGVILALGLCLLPFLDNLIKDDTNFINIYIVYAIFISDTVLPYFFMSYKVILLNADQKAYIVARVFSVINIVTFVIKILSLYIFSNYYIIILIPVIFSLIKYYIISKQVDKIYPYTKTLKPSKLEKSSQLFIRKNTFALLIYRVNGLVLNSTDNLILSYFIGLNMIGLYSNYLLIITNLKKLLNNFFDAILASIGNFNIHATVENKKKLFRTCLLVSCYMYSVVSIAILCVLSDFIELWLGAEFVLNMSTTIILSLNLFIYSFLKVYSTFRSAMGLFIYGKYRPLIGSILNIIISILLVKQFKLNGILLGTLTSNLLTFFWYDLYIIYKKGFETKYKSIILYVFKLISCFFLAAFLLYILTNTINHINIFTLLAKLIICFMGTSAIFWITNSRSTEYKYIVSKVKLLLTKKRNIQ